MNTVNVYIIIFFDNNAKHWLSYACLSFFFLGSMPWDVWVANHGMILMAFFFSLHIPFFSIPFYPYPPFFFSLFCFYMILTPFHPTV